MICFDGQRSRSFTFFRKEILRVTKPKKNYFYSIYIFKNHLNFSSTNSENLKSMGINSVEVRDCLKDFVVYVRKDFIFGRVLSIDPPTLFLLLSNGFLLLHAIRSLPVCFSGPKW